MAAVIANFNVEDFARWRNFFIEGESMRQEAGITGATILQAESDPNNVTLLLEVTDLERIKQYSQSAHFKEMIKRAGVIGEPLPLFFTTFERLPGASAAAAGGHTM